MNHSTPARKPDPVLINYEKRTWRLMDIAVPADYKVKVKKGK